jgi:N-carbamoylputrescine amidase
MRERINVTVTQLPAEPAALEAGWQALAAHVRQQESDLVLLPEMPFYPWLFRDRPARPLAWKQAVAAHETWLSRLAELAPAVVAASRPVTVAGRRLNEAFLWGINGGYRPVHHKRYLPDEAGFWEASWYERGDDRFEPVTVALADGTEIKLGFLICTELWFMERARAYGRAGVQLLLNPRATERQTRERWLVGGRAAAIIGGAYALSANHIEAPGEPEALGGQGWVVDPAGEVVTRTEDTAPFRTVPVNLAKADGAKQLYPQYVEA